MIALAAISLALPTSPGVAGRYFKTGNDLNRGCSSGSFDEAACMGYVLGVYDSLEGKSFCCPDGIIAKQVFDIVTLFMAQNPRLLHLPGNFIVVTALQEAFPCAKK